MQAAQWFVTRLNTNGRMLTSALCKDLRTASLDAVQITFYSADEAVHNELVGVDGYTDTVNGIKNALAAGLNVSLNTPLCSLNKDYRATMEFAHDLGIRYLTCSGLIPAGNEMCIRDSRWVEFADQRRFGVNLNSCLCGPAYLAAGPFIMGCTR